jgi:hypothetical protein
MENGDDDHKKLITLLGSPYAGSGNSSDFTALDLVERFVDICLYMPAKYRMAVALWTMHTHVYDQFDHTPRLAFLSPAPGWGKTQGLKLIQHLVPLPKPALIVDPTPAGLYQSVDAGITALLIDEVDNLNLKSNGRLRTVLNAFERGAAIPRGTSPKKGADTASPRLFRPFVPIAVGGIGKLPTPLTTRCIAIHMQKKPVGLAKHRVNTKDYQFVEAANLVLGAIMRWSDNIILDQHPDMAGLDNRFADVWRPLIAIADTCNRGDIVRTMAQGITSEFVEYDVGTHLLIDIRQVFDRLKVARIERQHLLNELHNNFDRWSDWGRPSFLTKNELLAILRDYHVPAVHPVRIDGELVQGWYRKDFEEAWRSC